LENILPENTQIYDYVVEENFPINGHKKVVVNARQIYQEGIKMILVSVEEL